ncbi:phosphate transporter [Ceraceosorus guamensis]|uniref:Phosphate transporter n=1 Tax=Ceraceosorus guamensis TaxID=1522189 RepID=A0A316VSB6_9BASI|nr:phosphate transporter [Ceraceosorus guamensis]PWN40487.1 phosphate transporter [Ceraceosorus guamensis]
MPVLTQYTYVFVIGTFFAMLDAFNNGANDVANAWATSVSSRSISYRAAMVCALVFELLGALTVGARTADTIKNGIIPNAAFQGNAGVQMLAFTCALAGASTWVMWCTRHSAHVSSTYSLISAVAGVGVATAGARNVQWGWNNGSGLGAIFSGLAMAPFASAVFGMIIFSLIKFTVHIRRNPVPWAVYTSPFFFLVAGTVCALSIVYKGSPNLKLNARPPWFIASVTLGVGFGLFFLAGLFFVPWLHAKVIKKDQELKAWEVIKGPLLWSRPSHASEAAAANVPNYAVVQHGDESATSSVDGHSGAYNDEKIAIDENSSPAVNELVAPQKSYKELEAEATERFHAKLRAGKGPLAWAMRFLHNNPMGAGMIYERHNLVTAVRRIPAMIVVGALYGMNYDIHAAQMGTAGTPEGARMEKVYNAATKYPNEVEHTYSFIQLITACTASFAHGANDVGNAVAPWAVIYSAWSTGDAAASKLPVPLWQIAVLALVLVLGFVTYGYNIMRVMGSKLTYHSPSRGTSMELAAAITIVIFSQYKLPVSTSMCITGATVGVGLMNGKLQAVNWQRVGLLFLSWVVTIPIAGLLGGIPMGIILNAPQFGRV